MVDWIADYWDRVGELPVLAQVEPGQVAAALPGVAPEHAEPLDAVLADLDAHLLPGVTHWQHPRFFAYFPANSSPAGVLGDLLSSGIGAQGMLWATSPAVTELEQVVLDWLRQALGLPDAFDRAGPGGGVIQDTASTATFTALLAALHRATGGAARRDGVPAGTCTVYGSTQAHSSLLKAVMMSGLGERALRSIAVDPRTQAMDVTALARGDGGRPGRGPDPRDGAGGRRYDVHGRGRPRRRHRRGGARARGLAARRRRVGGRGRGVPRAPLGQRRRRARRLLRHQPAQVAADDLRLQCVLGPRPVGARGRAVDPAGVPAQPGHRVRRRRRLPRLAPPARPALPGPEAVDRAAQLRAGGAARAHPRGRRPGRAVRRAGPRRRPVRDRHRAGAAAWWCSGWSTGTRTPWP